MKPRNERLRTAIEAHDQVRWDRRLDPGAFSVVLAARPSGTKEIPFDSFVPGGDIPWHRVLQLRHRGELAWCREGRLDRLDEIARTGGFVRPQAPESPPAISEPPVLPAAPTLAPLVAHVFSGGSWRPGSRPAPSAGDGSLRVATFNVLFDLYDADLIDTPRRTDAALRQLSALDADLIGLVEVTPGFLARLLAEPWVQERYAVSDGPGGSSVTPHGVLLLSRWPVQSADLCTLIPGRRRALIARIDGPHGLLDVAVVHLTSNAAEGAPELRQREARALLSALAWLAPSHPSVVLGDLNADTDLDPLLEAAGLVDAWPAVHPDERGATFDPARNALAALISRTGRAARYDRILCRGALRPTEASLFATGPLGTTGLFTSDHFGILARMESRTAPALDTLAPTYHSALVLIPPEELWGPIQEIRARHDRGYGRWMPHVSLVYGFVPDHAFDAAARRVEEVARSIDPFPVQLARTGRFEHGGSSTLWLAPEPEGPLQRLQAALAARFPRCVEKGRPGFTPHLTIARAPKAERAGLDALERQLRASWKAQSFVASEVQLISRRGEEPFEIRHRVALGGATRVVSVPRPPEPPTPPTPGSPDPFDPPVDPARITRREGVRVAVAQALGDLTATRAQTAEIEVLGSARLCPGLPSSDLDLLVIASPAADGSPLAPALLGALLTRKPFSAGRVAGGRVPALRLQAGDVGVDVLVVELPAGVPPGPAASLPAGVLSFLDEGARLAVLGPLENDALLSLTAPRTSLFPAVLSALKRWAEARGLRSPACGYPGGFSLATLAAHACAHAPAGATTTGALLRYLFESAASWPWPAPLALGPAPAPPLERRDVMPILTPLAPRRNSARTVTPATLSVWKTESLRAAQLIRQILAHRAAVSELFAPLDPATLGRPLLTLPEPATPGAAGLFEQRLPSLILALDREGLAPRPFRRGSGQVQVADDDAARAHRVLAGVALG
jgi:poly(A) polymerase